MYEGLSDTLVQLRDAMPELVRVIEEECGMPYGAVLFIEKGRLGASSSGKGKSQFGMAGYSSGLKLTGFDGRTFHNRNTDETDPDKVAEIATEFFSGIPVVGDIEIDPGKQIDKHFATPPGDLSLTSSERVAMAEDYAEIMGRLPGIVNPLTILREESTFRMFANGTSLLSEANRFYIAYLRPVAERGTTQVSNLVSQTGSTLDAFLLSPEFVMQAAQETVGFLDAEELTPGVYTVIMNPSLVGIAVHESFGHGDEADWSMGDGSRAVQYYGERVGSGLVTLVDNANMPGKHGHIAFDDEGYLSEEPTILVDKGVLKRQPMVDLWTFLMLKAQGKKIRRTPNGRAEDAFHDIYTRMTNTYGLPSPDGHTLDQMIKATKSGLLINGYTDGMEDPKNWGMQLAGLIALEIKDGQLTGRKFFKPGITGDVLEFLGSVDMVGTELSGFGGGYCGKGHADVIPVGGGGEYWRCKARVT